MVDKLAIQKFRASLCGELLAPGEDGYNNARKIWNGMADRRPQPWWQMRLRRRAVDYARQQVDSY